MGVTALIPVVTGLLINMIKIAQQAKELSKEEFDQVKKKLDDEFNNIPEWKDL